MIRFNCPDCGRLYELPDALASLPLVCKQCGRHITPPAPTPDPPPPPPPPPRPVAAPAVPVAPPKPAPKPLPPKPAEPPKAPPVPVAAPAAKPAPPPPLAPVVAPTKLSALPPDELDDDDVLVAKPDESPDIDFNIGGPTAASLSDATRTRPGGLTDATRRPPDLSGAVGPVDSLAELNLDLLGPPPPVPAPKPPASPPPEEPPEPKPEPTLVPFVADLVVFLLLVVAGLFLGELAVRKKMGEVLSEAGSAAKFPPVDLLLLVAPALMFGLIYVLLNSRQLTLGAWLRRRRSAP